ncbi:Ubiquitin fusion degradation protein 1 [Sesamum angolense]|uniref:Ubiquitin fusion degradation protein 1 n=1 Tax=Sesamum angolense TaxID=2727404 RepID=A0AAE1WXH8_9LAMI|nr:Ubiquitin fusion degradation protein 1 [Sesamum angolense]
MDIMEHHSSNISMLPASFIDKAQIENGDKVIMPPSALDRLASLHIDYPMLFELQNAAAERISHCGVLEFIAEEGMIYMPYWMMENLLLQEGDFIRVKNVTLPKGTYVKLQPHTKDFLDISKSYLLNLRAEVTYLLVQKDWMPSNCVFCKYSVVLDSEKLLVSIQINFGKNPVSGKKIWMISLCRFTTLNLIACSSLETTLRNFSCLTTGDSIMVAYNNKKYYIDIVETKPSNAISIIETDCEVDFAPPLDYKEPEKPALLFQQAKHQQKEPQEETEPKFNPFTGVGRRLDGKPLKTPSPPVSSSGPQDKRTNASGGGAAAASSSSSQSTNRQSQGKLVFGSNASRTREPQEDTSKETKQEPPKKEEPKFQAFSGKKYSLKG